MTIAQPYIGVTGVVSRDDVRTIAECAAIVRNRAPSHRLMAGVLVSSKTLREEWSPNRRYPVYDDVEGILAAVRNVGAWPVIHYNTRSEGAALGAELLTIAMDNDDLTGVQLNIAAPHVPVLREVADEFPGIEFILQLKRSAIVDANVSAWAVPRYAQSYSALAAHALLDFSEGDGVPIEPMYAARVVRHWNEAMGTTRLGIAGRLGPDCAETLHTIRESVGADRFAELSFGAESGVRVPVADPRPGEKCQDALDHDKALAYVNAVCDALGGPR